MAQGEKRSISVPAFVVRRVLPWFVLFGIVYGVFNMGRSLMSQKPVEQANPMETTQAAAPSTKALAKAKVVNDTLRFRSEPSMSGDVLDTFLKGTVVTIVGRPSKDWLKVKTTQGKVGYIFSSNAYVQIIPAKKK